MGVFLRKSFGAGPVRFNLSKSGIGISGGVKGLRIGTGPRGAYLSGGRKGIYYRQSLGGAKRGSGAQSAEPAVPVAAPPSKSSSESNGLSVGLGLLAALLLLFAGLFIAAEAIAPGIVALVLFTAIIGWIYLQSSTTREYLAMIARLTSSSDPALLASIRAKRASVFIKAKPARAAEGIAYARILDDALEGGIDDAEKQWLSSVSTALMFHSTSLHTEMMKFVMWELMVDSEVTEEEEAHISNLAKDLDVNANSISDEWDALQQFVRARKMLESSELPVVVAPIPLQRGETCHHITSGAFMDMRVLRSYTQGGQKMKDEGLVASNEGDIYVTSKRILLVGNGTASIPQDKVVSIEIDQDEKLIELVKDGRQKPLFIKVPDAIYTGKLMERISGVMS